MTNYNELIKRVFDLDPQIRFAAVVNNKGELIAGGPKDNVEQFLVGDQIDMSIHYVLQKRSLFINLAYKIGHERSSITEFDKVTMISIPINSNELFLISTELRTDYLKIIDFVISAVNPQ